MSKFKFLVGETIVAPVVVIESKEDLLKPYRHQEAYQPQSMPEYMLEQARPMLGDYLMSLETARLRQREAENLRVIAETDEFRAGYDLYQHGLQSRVQAQYDQNRAADMANQYRQYNQGLMNNPRNIRGINDVQES